VRTTRPLNASSHPVSRARPNLPIVKGDDIVESDDEAIVIHDEHQGKGTVETSLSHEPLSILKKAQGVEWGTREPLNPGGRSATE